MKHFIQHLAYAPWWVIAALVIDFAVMLLLLVVITRIVIGKITRRLGSIRVPISEPVKESTRTIINIPETIINDNDREEILQDA